MCQEKHCGDNNNSTDDCVALVEHATNGKKRTKAKAKMLHYDDQIIPCPWLTICI